MPFETNGYRPRTFEEILQPFTDGINTQFNKSYDTTTIVGTNFYKYGYTAMQLVMQAEAETAELGAKMQDYIRNSNEKINLPKSTVEGFIKAIKDELGLDSTIKNLTISAEAGHLFLIVDTPTPIDPDIKDEIITRQHNYLTAGLYYEGSITGSKVAFNGQTFDYAFDTPDLVDILVRITVTVSANALTPIFNENQIRNIFNENFAELYRLGLDFEPEKYLEIARDLPFASDILLEYSEDDGATWDFEPRTMPYDEKINITDPAEIIIVT